MADSDITTRARAVLCDANEQQRRQFTRGVHGPTSATVDMPDGTTRCSGSSVLWTDLGRECSRLANLPVHAVRAWDETTAGESPLCGADKNGADVWGRRTIDRDHVTCRECARLITAEGGR